MSFSQVKYSRKPWIFVETSRIIRSKVEGTFPIVEDSLTLNQSDSLCCTKSR
jgi:hypothetical protein